MYNAIPVQELKPRQIKNILDEKAECAKYHQQAPAHGLYLVNVYYDKNSLTALQRSHYSKVHGYPV